METKEDLIENLEKKINAKKDMMIDSISYLQEALNEIENSMNIISYLSCLRDEFIKKDGV